VSFPRFVGHYLKDGYEPSGAKEADSPGKPPLLERVAHTPKGSPSGELPTLCPSLEINRTFSFSDCVEPYIPRRVLGGGSFPVIFQGLPKGETP